jgi:hypothetical protein
MALTLDPAFSVNTTTLTNANESLRVDMGGRGKRMTVFFATNAGKIADAGTDGVVLAAGTYADIDADKWFVVEAPVIYIESAVASTVVTIIAEN